MSNPAPNRVLLAVLALVSVSLSCVSAPGTSEVPPEASNSCQGTSFLRVTSAITKQETNQFGTRLCEYTVTITNTKDVGIWVYFYQHEKDGYARTERRRWMGNLLVEPGQEATWSGSVYIYNDKDADGPLMSVPDRITGVYDLPECAEDKRDEAILWLYSRAVEAVCPVE